MAEPDADTAMAIAGQGWELPQLMASLQGVQAATASFIERKYMRMLKEPLQSSGQLVYVRPDKLAAPEFAEYDHPGTPARLAALREVAKDAGATVNQVVLAWLIGGQVPMIPVVGASTVTATASGIFGTAAPLGAGDGVGAGVGDGDGAVVADPVGAVVAPPVPAWEHAAARARLNASASVRRNIPHLSAKDRRTARF